MKRCREIAGKCVALLAFWLATAQFSVAQNIPDSILKNYPLPELGPNDTIPVPVTLFDNQIVPAQTLEWIWVQAKYPPHLLKKREAYNRLRNAVYVCYPYARRAGIILNDINYKLAGMNSKSERKKYIKSREKELKKEFSDPLTNLSIYQGKVLMKLINRETGNNCYDIIKEYKGGVTARLYQTVAFFYNSSLKQPYEVEGKDSEIEKIVLEVEKMYVKKL
ncbi:DUF4294 domain-containing protein [Flavitalea antarctica]